MHDTLTRELASKITDALEEGDLNEVVVLIIHNQDAKYPFLPFFQAMTSLGYSCRERRDVMANIYPGLESVSRELAIELCLRLGQIPNPRITQGGRWRRRR